VSDVQIKIEMFGDKLFQAKLRRVAERVDDPAPVLLRIGHKWLGWIEQQFGTEGVRFLGSRWAGLAFRTIKARGAAHPILFDSGDLFDDMTEASNLRIIGHTLFLGLSDYADEIGGYHQSGTSTMPQRKILDFGPEDRRMMYDDLSDWFFKGSLTG
jgi:phage gpG-like protein